MGCDKILDMGEFQMKNHGNTYEITIRPQDRLIVTVQHEDIKTVTSIHHVGISSEQSSGWDDRFVSHWSFNDVSK